MAVFNDIYHNITISQYHNITISQYGFEECRILRVLTRESISNIEVICKMVLWSLFEKLLYCISIAARRMNQIGLKIVLVGVQAQVRATVPCCSILYLHIALYLYLV